MTTDIKELVGVLKSSLNDKDNMPRMSTEFVRTLRVFDVAAAADALEALAGEVERLKDACKYDALNAGAIAEIRRACKEIMGGNVTFVDDDFARCLFTLSAERDRLKAALGKKLSPKARKKLGDLSESMIAIGDGRELELILNWYDESRKALGDAS